MIFSTYWFLAAAAIFFPVYWLVRTPRVRLFCLLLFCAIFHTHFAGPAGVAPIVVLAVCTFFLARTRNSRACVAGIVLCVIALCFYKYLHFLTNGVIGLVNPGGAKSLELSFNTVLPAAPPLAISFFVFEFVHYLYEVKRGKAPITSPVEFAQFAIYFPSLVAGPIKRYDDFLPSLHRGLEEVTAHDVCAGFIRVMVGFAKKAVIADQLTSAIDLYVPRFTTLNQAERWCLLIEIAFRIYMDFSGYSDMAVGLSQMMGIKLPTNFNWPYLACNVREFWLRWHISLSSWIRDYVYIPLGGNRAGKLRTILNGILAFALCGLWHGPDWHFLFWGLYHGVGLAICSTYRTILGAPGRVIGMIFDKVPFLAWALTFLYVSLGWLLFFYPARDAWRMTRYLFKHHV